MKTEETHPQFAVCIDNTGYPASLELRKIYQVLPDEKAAKHKLVRVIDESGRRLPVPPKVLRSYRVAARWREALQGASDQPEDAEGTRSGEERRQQERPGRQQ